MNSQKPHWEVLSQSWQRKHPQRLWREHCDAVNLAMLQKWWPGERVESVLKSDLFDEVFGRGLYPFIQPKVSTLGAIDLSESIVSAARTKYPDVQATVADVRRLPVRDDTYDLIISNSTLDHFESKTDITVALRREVRRAGFRVTETESVMHCPRVVAVAIAGLIQRHAKHRTQQRFLRGLMAFEKLARLPTRYFTGHFVAVRAVKIGAAQHPVPDSVNE